MAELEQRELPRLAELVEQKYSVESRMMLDITVVRDGRSIYTNLALNEAVVTRGAVSRVIRLHILTEQGRLFDLTGDGVIIATPTGSTAYSLSAGGPIVEPEAHSILVTPICAHDVASRGFVASDNRVITVELMQNARRNAFLSVDGGKAVRMNMGDVATVRKTNFTTKLLRLKERSFYDVVNMKFKNI
jgi:NAD+ kinase